MLKKASFRSLSFLVAPLMALLLTSCFETKQAFVLNPDGSGKVVHECAFQEVNLSNQNDTSEEALQSAIAGVIKSSKGVDAWKDVSFKRLPDGRLWFRGTAYFKNLDEFEIQNQSMLKFSWKMLGDGKADLTLDLNKKEKGDSKGVAKTTTEERKHKLAEERAKFQQSKPMMAAVLGAVKQTVSFNLPGKVGGVSNFQLSPAGDLNLSFSGAKMLEAMEKLISNDAWLEKNGFDMEDAPELDSELGGMLFGQKAPVKASVTGAAKPLFDYAAEVAVARKEADALQKQLGIVSVAPPAAGEALKSIKVVGVRFVSAVDKKLEVRPFNSDEGYTLSVLAQLPGSVLDVTDESAITSAIASDGSDLLKGDRDWDRRLGFPKLSTDKASVMFEIELKRPAPGVTGIKEVSGNLQYRVSGGVKEVDLGLAAIKTGAQGTQLGASIEAIKEGWRKDGSQDLELRLRIDSESLKAAYLVVNGTKTELDRGGFGSSSGITRFTLTSKKNFPEKGKIVVEVHDQVQTFNVPFKIENVSLLGTPQ